ncbi:glycolate oxidase subunit GlcF [Agrobacterium vitis]|uniref:Glycolate oxidase iron-sulfur subunit n=1 Tax=Agrobacterium vitis TaxID=373 RepID=A0AAE2UTB3_AGRVI|nr:glycolate oxidase subunit GlcF [Agrobacterium vitis]MBF2713360.1 glycolate oxidase subunit GlcF [Agrobacterium vitis]MUZ62463.1 glycolate oxidase subunit GlcF [Agrobacterium vitis]MVA18421.1 glycolate oxidase subunit GlcF [Agrobacterium vitis]
MQTNFSITQLADPKTAEAESILRRCVHCGFCTATCPTYVTLGNELDSPRGRIYLIKDMLENGRAADEEIVTHIDRCLSCLACTTTCPSGVDYMHLVDHARNHIENTYQRPLADRLLRKLLAAVLPYPGRMRVALAFARFGRPFAPLMERVAALKPMAAMLRLAPQDVPYPSSISRPGLHSARGNRKGRVALLTGCAQSVLDPGINDATVALLTRLGIEVVVPKGEGCCGALVHHMGRETDALAAARRNIDAWMVEIGSGETSALDAIVITTSGCGTTIKDYGHMLRHDPVYSAKAARVSALAKDVSEYLSSLDLPQQADKGVTVAYHSACSLQHGQKITALPKLLLKTAGFTVRDPAEGHLCCGSAGTYNILQPDISQQLKARKLRNIQAVNPDVIAAGNIGCMTQIGSGTDIPVVHTVELLNWAFGGEKPQKLKDL